MSKKLKATTWNDALLMPCATKNCLTGLEKVVRHF